MKKARIIQLSLALVLIAFLLIGCSTSDGKTGSDGTNTRPDQAQSNPVNADPVSPADSGNTYVDPIVQENEAVAGIIQSAENLLNQGYYAQAYRTLNDAIAKYGTRQDLSSALLNCEQLYVQDALTRAGSKFNESKDYEEAIDILMLAQVDLEDSAELQAAIEQYQSYRPIKLNELESFYEEHPGFGSNHGFGPYKDNTITDNCGNEYQGYWDGYGGGSTIYRINGKYTRLTGVVFTPSEHKNKDNLGHVTIYGNGRELWDSGKVGKGIEPVCFDLDVTGITELKIETDYNYSPSLSPYLADIWLYAEP